MSSTRELAIIEAFVGLSNELVDDYDVVDMLSRLTVSCTELLDIASVGLLLADESGVLQLAAWSSERTRELEIFQLQRDEGPCLDCYHGAEVVRVPDLAAAEERWPQFSGAAREAGFEAVHAVPMRLRDHVFGAVGLFGQEVGDLPEDDIALAQALVHVASVAIVNEKVAADRTTVNAQLQRALTGRIVLEQAKGVLAHSGGLEMGDAFDALRRYARSRGTRLSDVAAAVVDRRLSADAVLRDAARPTRGRT